MKAWIATATVTATATAIAASGAALAWPLQASPALRPPFTATICTAKPPRLTHAYAAGITITPSASIIRVADPAAISNEDHAELLFKLGLLEGHLLVGRELVDAKRPQLALPHFGHPVRELYDDIQPELAKRGLSQFDGELIALEALAAGQPGAPAMTAQFDKVLAILAALRATVPAPLLDNERFMLGMLAEVAVVASEDYSQSIESNRIAKPVEYHDSRGYLAYADKELKRLESRPTLANSPRIKAARAKLTEMQAIVATLIPPTKPVKTVAQYKAIVAQFKQATTPGA